MADMCHHGLLISNFLKKIFYFITVVVVGGGGGGVCVYVCDNAHVRSQVGFEESLLLVP